MRAEGPIIILLPPNKLSIHLLGMRRFKIAEKIAGSDRAKFGMTTRSEGVQFPDQYGTKAGEAAIGTTTTVSAAHTKGPHYVLCNWFAEGQDRS